MKRSDIRICAVLCGALLAACSNQSFSPSLPMQWAARAGFNQEGASRVEPSGRERVLYRFKGGTDGFCACTLIAVNGTLYGTAGENEQVQCEEYGTGCGTIFSMHTSGSGYRVLHRYHPDRGGVFALTYANGELYGATTHGGDLKCDHDYGCGTVFKVDPSGAPYKVVYRFAGSDTGHPGTELLAVNDVLYGATLGGASTCSPSQPGTCGTLYTVNIASGKKRVLYGFQGGDDGYEPNSRMIELNGTLYGTTLYGGRTGCGNGCGTIFKIRPSGGGYRVVYRFTGHNVGDHPINMIDVNGTLYGMAANSAAKQDGCDRYNAGCGTLFKFDTASDRAIVLHRFRPSSSSDGLYPQSLLASANGALYGTTKTGGDPTCQCGAVFKFDLASGRYTVLYRFKAGEDAAYPDNGVIEVNRVLYGTTSGGGTNGPSNGTVFSLSL